MKDLEAEWGNPPPSPEEDMPKEDAKPERKPLASFLVNHADTLGMTWQEIDALRPPYVIDGFIRQGEVMLLGAESKSRKSWLVQDAAFAVAAGLPWLSDEDGCDGFATAQSGVHVLDLELNDSEMRFRFAKARANRFPDFPDHAESVTRRISAYSLDGLGVAEILPLLNELEATVSRGDLVVIDCLYRLVPDGNETAEIAMMLERIKRFARSTGAAVIVVDHFRKAGDDKARNRFNGSFVKQASASTLVAIETKPDDVLALNIDARTFHGCPLVHAKFNLETYAFDRIPDADVQAAREASSMAEAEGWLVKVWRSRALTSAATNADAREKWEISRPAADTRFSKLVKREFVVISDERAGQAKKWALTAKGQAVVKSALNLHPDLHP